MQIETNKDFDCYDVAEMNGINRGITIDGKTLNALLAEERIKAIDEFVNQLKQSLLYTYAEGGWEGYTVEEKEIDEVAKQMKESKNNTMTR